MPEDLVAIYSDHRITGKETLYYHVPAEQAEQKLAHLRKRAAQHAKRRDLDAPLETFRAEPAIS